MLLNKGYKVYISYYAMGDIPVCEKIKALFSENTRVEYIDKNISCLEYAKILPKFKIVITSRFHSAVHAYKNCVPCMVIGWAVKYVELTNSLGQAEMMFDCEKDINEEDFINKLEYLLSNRDSASETIKQKLIEIQKNNCFDKMWKIFGRI